MKISNNYTLYNTSKVSNTNNSNNKVVFNKEGKQKDNRSSQQYSEINNFKSIHYLIIYNNATLSKADSDNNQLTEDEINKEVDMVLYKEYRLEEQGIEFGSDEFKAWQVKYKNNIDLLVRNESELS